MTNGDGRCSYLFPPPHSDEAKQEMTAGKRYKMIFKTKEYFDRTNRTTFYPCVEVNSKISRLGGTNLGTLDTIHD